MRISRVLPALIALGVVAPAAHAAPSAVVTMGDSYISGEAGRWAGNSVDPSPGHAGTDRACLPAGSPACQVDLSRVYVDGTAANGCHRSDVAEIRSARLPVSRRINLACSGAVTKNLLTAAAGGVGQGGEAPQGDQLAAVARADRVKAIVVSIGGNDLGFGGIVAGCFQAYVQQTGPCRPVQQAKLAAALPAATTKVEGAIDAVRGVMRGAGHADREYRLILQTYPSVAGRAAENRYVQGDPRRVLDGCANYDVDLDWARDEASREIGSVVANAARARGAELLDLHDLFQGHEVCAKTAAEATAASRPPSGGSEWGRFLSASTFSQGQAQEAFHPNAFGQRAIGACLTATYAATVPGRFTCSSRAGRAPTGVRFTRTATLPGRRLRLRLHRVRRAGPRVCIAFRVRAGGRAARGATVRFAGRRRRTGRSGRATICRRLRPGRYAAVARKDGYRAARRSVPVRR